VNFVYPRSVTHGKGARAGGRDGHTHTRPRVVQVVGVQRRGREVSDLSIGRSGDGSMTILIGHVRCH
jgi:hypothetical protein